MAAEFAVHALRELVGGMKCGRPIHEDVVIKTRGALLFEEPTNPAHHLGVDRASVCPRLKDHHDARAFNADSEEGSVRKRAMPVVYCVVVITDHRIQDRHLAPTRSLKTVACVALRLSGARLCPSL